MRIIIITIISILAISTLINCSAQSVKEQDERVIGTWMGFLIDSESGDKMSPMTMEFTKDGQLVYVLDPGTEMQNEFSVGYRTQNGWLHTKDLESGEEEKAKYRVSGDQLIITIGKIENAFIKREAEPDNQ